MRRTRFYSLHQRLGAKIVPFAGFEMPIHYPRGILHEHTVVRTAVGVFDVSHMGEFEIRGPQALEFVQYITVNDASKLVPGKAQYSVMCNEHGGIIDDLLVYRLATDRFMLVVNAACEEKDWQWIQQHAQRFDVQLENISEAINLLAVQGPRAIEALQPLTPVDLSAIAYYSFVEGELASVPMVLSRTGYTGELGFELYFRGDEQTAEHVWTSLMEAGRPYGIEPVGLGARDTLRLEKGYCLYGNDIDETTTPLEAGLGWITKLQKGEFIGRDALLEQKQRGVERKLVGFVVEAERFIPRGGYTIAYNGTAVGRVTSGSISPSLGVPIGLGYVPTALAEVGTPLEIIAGTRSSPARVVALPFYPPQ
ncbi:MAG: glycine cleavage system aminomethyltransferase GcvT [Bacteroidota bacterium]|nr:glycine cleavage system aminomethyltransferase GcvT [Candidatus Kapabacteria bacterium]MDW8075426.1 glycine cleavage system aminomethyltransferase GcvT [Bacteroidota bacterium]